MNLFDSKYFTTKRIYLAAGTIVLVPTGILSFLYFDFSPLFAIASVILLIVPYFLVGFLAYHIFADKLEQKTTEITEASRIHLATVEALATAIDARDQVGMGHVRRTQIYAVGIGEVLGLSQEEIQALRTGALLHDIGKLGVPDHILNKPGKLTSAEMEKMKTHSKVGASILEKVGFPYPVVPTVKHHHEMWNGNGYPNRLKREEIPLTARILAVADTYDTLRGARPYRPAVSRKDAQKFLLNGAGIQFDPKIVNVFLNNLISFEELIEAEGLMYENDSQPHLLPLTGEEDGELSYVHQIKSANREVFKLYELARIFGSVVNLGETFSLFTTKLAELVRYNTCVIYLCDDLRDEAIAAFVAGENNREIQGLKIRSGVGVTGNVLKNRKPVSGASPAGDFRGFGEKSFNEYKIMMSLPLIADEKLIGAVSLYSTETETYGEEHLRMLETFCLIASDAIYKSLKHAETETHAMTDPMTGLPNARSLRIHFEKEAARAKRKGHTVHLMMLDLDEFKAVNDNFGHKAGDDMLKEISAVIARNLREYDFLARYAGDEFIAVIPETDDLDIRDLCARIEEAINNFKLQVGDNRCAQVGISIGTASYPANGESLDQVIMVADKAMYAVKDLHRCKKEFVKDTDAPAAERPSDDDVPEKSGSQETDDGFVVEVDESHIISTAIN